jgi:S-adenosylmethionine hydrolase
VVIDPGVGTDRAAIAVASEGRFLVGPDTGVLSPALLGTDARVVRLTIPRGAAPTFHGRDVFAPAAARLAQGGDLESVGSPFTESRVRRTPEPHRRGDGVIVGEVIHIDRFGNAVTNLLAPYGGSVEAGGQTLSIGRTYADVDPGRYTAVSGSSGLVEIARRDGDAASSLGLARGSVVLLRPASR